MANSDYVPNGDLQFKDWLRNFVTVLAPLAEQLGLQENDVTDLAGKREEFEAAIMDVVAKRAAARGAVQNKKAVRMSAEKMLRPLVRRITAHPSMDNALRSRLGLNVPSERRAVYSAGSEAPEVYLEAKPGSVLIHFGTNPGNEHLNGKPDWAKGCNIYRKKDGEPEYSFIAFDTSSPYLDHISGPPTRITYKVAYRATRERDIGPSSEGYTIAAGG